MQIICRNPTVMDRIRSVVSITSSELFSTSVTSIFLGDTWLRLCVKSSTSIPPTSIRISFPLPEPPYESYVMTNSVKLLLRLFYLLRRDRQYSN